MLSVSAGWAESCRAAWKRVMRLHRDPASYPSVVACVEQHAEAVISPAVRPLPRRARASYLRPVSGTKLGSNGVDAAPELLMVDLECVAYGLGSNSDGAANDCYPARAISVEIDAGIPTGSVAAVHNSAELGRRAGEYGAYTVALLIELIAHSRINGTPQWITL